MGRFLWLVFEDSIVSSPPSPARALSSIPRFQERLPWSYGWMSPCTYLSRDARPTHTPSSCFHLQLSAWPKLALTGTGPTAQGQVRVLPFFIQHQIHARPMLEARKSDMSWVQSCPQEAPRLEGRWPCNRELPVCDVRKCQELGARNQGRFSG